MKGLTKKQAKLLRFIIDHLEQNGCAPTFKEMLAEMGVKHTMNITDHLKRLEKKGYIKRSKGTMRSILPLKNTQGQPVRVQVVVIEEPSAIVDTE